MTQEKAINSLMTESRTFPPPESIQKNSYISSDAQYKQMWDKSIKDPDGFWLEQAKSLSWFKEPTKSLEYTWDWFQGVRELYQKAAERGRSVIFTAEQ